MKSLTTVVEELREQIEEATDPRDPEKLKHYTTSLRDGVESFIPALPEDPTMAALALYGQVQFVSHHIFIVVLERGIINKDDWPEVKRSVLVHPKAHAAINAIEAAGFEEVLVAAMVANWYLSTQHRKIKRKEIINGQS